MIIGGYTLDLYCDQENENHEYNEFPQKYYHEQGSVCRARARKAGWVLHKDGTATCPKCNPKATPVDAEYHPDLCTLDEIKRRVPQ